MRISEYTGFLQQFGIIYTLKEIYYRFFNNILENIVYLRRDKDTFRYLKRYLVNIQKVHCTPVPLKNLKPCIWTCWLQGYENAPPVVKTCIDSMRKHSGNHEVIIITEKNINEYVLMPEYIMEKFRKGIIPVAHFSDLLRTLLLINYGGIWIDATVFLSDNIPENILKSDFFVFQNSALQVNFQPCSSWFIVANKNNCILTGVFAVLSEYWKKNNYLIHYFLFHIALKFVITNLPEASELWNRMFYKNNSDPHYLQKILFRGSDTDIWNHILDLSFAHKLTYKFTDNSMTEVCGTFYQNITKTLSE